MRRLAGGLSLLAASVAACGEQASREQLKEAVEKLAPGESTTFGDIVITMLEKQAGTRDADGWYPAASNPGRFEVRMPVPYNSMTTTAPTEDGSLLETATIGGRSAEGARFVANCMRRADGVSKPGWVESVTGALVKGAAIVEKAPVVKDGATGVRLRLRRGTTTFVGLFLAGEGRSCQVSVEYSGEDPAIDAVARTFMDSFSFTAGTHP